MNSLEKRLTKLEKIAKTKYTHHGVFIIYINNGIYSIANNEEKGISFNNEYELEDYIYSKYNCEKYVFITIDFNRKS